MDIIRTSFAAVLLLLTVSTSGSSQGAAPWTTNETGYGASRSVSWSSRQQTSSQTWAIHENCSEAAARLDRTLAAMVPGRTWTWQLDAERRRELLDELQSNLVSLRACEDDFEAKLTEHKSQLEPELTRVRQLWQQLESDKQSLEVELQEKYPARWHVSQDVSHMQAETRKWRKLQKRMANEVKVNQTR